VFPVTTVDPHPDFISQAVVSISIEVYVYNVWASVVKHSLIFWGLVTHSSVYLLHIYMNRLN